MSFCVTLKDIFKPPVLVFFVAITALAITLFAFSLSLETKKDRILNPDIQNWNDFYKSVSGLNVCLQTKSKEKNNVIKPNHNGKKVMLKDKRAKNTTKVAFFMDATLTIDESISRSYFIHGIIRGDQLGHFKSNDVIHITVSLPKPRNSEKHETLLPCVSLEGPPYLLPNSKNVPIVCSPPKAEPLQELYFVFPQEINNETICPSQHTGSLTFKEKEDLNVYLSEMDTGLVQMHVLVTSAVLFAMILCFIIYSLFGRVCRSDKKHSSDPELIVCES